MLTPDITDVIPCSCFPGLGDVVEQPDGAHWQREITQALVVPFVVPVQMDPATLSNPAIGSPAFGAHLET